MRRNELACVVLLAAGFAEAGVAQDRGRVEGVVESGGAPVRDVVVYLTPERPAEQASVVSSTPPVIDQSRLRFLPAVLVVRPGQEVSFLNSDPIMHNVFSPGLSGERFDLGTYPTGMTRSHTFTQPGPHVILCNVHPEMAAYVVVVTTPHHAVSDGDGRFRIEEVPAGSYRMSVWRRGHPSENHVVVVPSGGLHGLRLDLDASVGPLSPGRR